MRRHHDRHGRDDEGPWPHVLSCMIGGKFNRIDEPLPENYKGSADADLGMRIDMPKEAFIGWLAVTGSLTLFGGAGPLQANICGLPPEMFDQKDFADGQSIDELIAPYLFNDVFDVPNFAPDDRLVFGRFSAPNGFQAKLDEALEDYMAKRWPDEPDMSPDESVSDFGHWMFMDAVTFEGQVFDPQTGWQQETLVLDVPYNCGEEGYCELGINLGRPSINMIHKYGDPDGPMSATVLSTCDSINGLDVVTQARVDELHQCLLANRCPH